MKIRELLALNRHRLAHLAATRPPRARKTGAAENTLASIPEFRDETDRFIAISDGDEPALVRELARWRDAVSRRGNAAREQGGRPESPEPEEKLSDVVARYSPAAAADKRANRVRELPKSGLSASEQLRALREALSDGDFRVRQAAVEVLGDPGLRLTSAEKRDLLVKALGDDEAVANLAARGIGASGLASGDAAWLALEGARYGGLLVRWAALNGVLGNRQIAPQDQLEAQQRAAAWAFAPSLEVMDREG